MAQTDTTFIYVATYPNETAAQADFQVAKDLRAGGLVGSYDAAIVTKDATGQGAREQGRDRSSPRHVVGHRSWRGSGRSFSAGRPRRCRGWRCCWRCERSPGQGPCWPIVAHAGRLGLPTRIGLEDTIVGPDGGPVTDNADLVRLARAVWTAAREGGR